MPAPSSSDAFIKLVHKSGLIESDRLDAFLRQHQSAGTLPEHARKAAELFVREALLTYFQAEQFLLGKSRGFSIGKYHVLERIGSGGTGVVYLCEHKFMRRRVAVKVLSTALADDPDSVEFFYREGMAAAALDHPNIVRAHDIGQDANFHFMVMEYVDGASLEKLVKHQGPLDIRWASHCMRQAALGLQHAHEAGMVHRDIKPGNLLIDRQGLVKILDLGLARFFQDNRFGETSSKKYANLLGTVDYLSPEQAINSEHVDIRGDIYSLGATFHYLLSGKPPFEEGSLAQKLIWHQLKQPRGVCEIRPEVPAELGAVIEKMMSKDPDKRYAFPVEVIEALSPWTKAPFTTPQIPRLTRLSPAARRSGSPTGGAAIEIPRTSRPTDVIRRESAHSHRTPVYLASAPSDTARNSLTETSKPSTADVPKETILNPADTVAAKSETAQSKATAASAK